MCELGLGLVTLPSCREEEILWVDCISASLSHLHPVSAVMSCLRILRDPRYAAEHLPDSPVIPCL